MIHLNPNTDSLSARPISLIQLISPQFRVYARFGLTNVEYISLNISIVQLLGLSGQSIEFALASAILMWVLNLRLLVREDSAEIRFKKALFKFMVRLLDVGKLFWSEVHAYAFVSVK